MRFFFCHKVVWRNHGKKSGRIVAKTVQNIKLQFDKENSRRIHEYDVKKKISLRLIANSSFGQ